MFRRAAQLQRTVEGWWEEGWRGGSGARSAGARAPAQDRQAVPPLPAAAAIHPSHPSLGSMHGQSIESLMT